MLKLARNFSILILIGLASLEVKSQSTELLHEIFASAVATHSQTFAFLTATIKPDWGTTKNISSWNTTCLDVANNFSAVSTCLQQYATQCFSLKDLTSLYNITSEKNLSKQDVASLSPALIYSLISCDDKELQKILISKGTTPRHEKPTSGASWGYSMLFVTLINLCSLVGVIVLPCMKMKIYKLVLMFMVGLAVGTLCGSSLLFLIPEAFLLGHDGSLNYIWKSTTIIGGIYLFFITEKIMRMINARRENTNIKKKRDEMATQGAITTSFRRVPIDNTIPGKDPSQIVESLGGICTSPSILHRSLHSSSSSEISSQNFPRKRDAIDDLDFSAYNSKTEDSHVPSFSEQHERNGIAHGSSHHPTEVAPVAYMIIFGDALHNFIDGLSIGSAFTQSIVSGISVCVAVMCEELPHELGDFAILLNSGMRFKKALMYNFLSACTCYLGNIVGILLGENTQSHEWIFAVAGGMFLYISLVDMMPEMNTAAETEAGKQFGEKKTLILQNCGLLTGYSVMLVFALFGDYISIG